MDYYNNSYFKSNFRGKNYFFGLPVFCLLSLFFIFWHVQMVKVVYRKKSQLFLFVQTYFDLSSMKTVGASLIAQLVKNPPAMQETWVWPLGWEDLLENGKAPVFWLGVLHDCSPWHRKESDTTERLSLHFIFFLILFYF